MNIKWHILFWFLYLVVESFIVYNTGEWMHRSFTHSLIFHGSLLVPRVIISYAFIQYLLPYLQIEKSKLVFRVLLTIVYFAAGLLLYRIFLNMVSWPLFMGHWPIFDPFSLQLSSYSFLRLITPLSLLLGVLSVRKEYLLRIKNEQLQKEQLQSELNFLKAQINPHFLFNSFNSLYVLAMTKSDQTAPAIEKLSSLFRYILNSSSIDRIAIDDELKMLNNYIDLEKLRYDDLIVNIDLSIQNGKLSIPPLLLLPFIENAFKHGASELLSESFVDIKISQSEETLDLVCKNTFNPNAVIEQRRKGAGIENVTKRLDLLFDKRYILSLESIDALFIVKLSIPLDKSV